MRPPLRSPRARPLAGFALVSLMASAAAACRRTAPPTPPDARATPAPAARDGGVDFGPPNPWGDGALPDSTASGPQAEATRTAMTALRASIGFWRAERHAPHDCPTLEQLAQTPAAAFDPATMRGDAWGTALEIECQGQTVRVRSLGPDRVRATPDDLLSY